MKKYFLPVSILCFYPEHHFCTWTHVLFRWTIQVVLWIFIFICALPVWWLCSSTLSVSSKKSPLQPPHTHTPHPIWIVTVNWKSVSFKRKSQALVQCLAYSGDSINVCGMCEQISHLLIVVLRMRYEIFFF